MNDKAYRPTPTFRLVTVALLVLVVSSVLLWRAVDLHVLTKDFLQQQGNARYLRVQPIAAHRGMISDRNGEPLAISTPVDSVWVHPKTFITASREWGKLAKLLGMSLPKMKRQVLQRKEREFVYLKRHINPALAKRVMDLHLPGVSLQREYRRYYPAGEVMAHVVGFTNIDDQGQEGLELAYDNWLHGVSGRQRVLKDRLGRVVRHVEQLSKPEPGKELVLSLDRRLQYLAYRELKRAVLQYNARSGSVVVMDVQSGEVLAMVNQPSYNPNNRGNFKTSHTRNRAVTDVFEPGSTLKPFTLVAALESGRFLPSTIIDTTPGRLRLGKAVIHDARNYGRIDVATVLQKSSNVGASKIALSLPADALWKMYDRLGFGIGSGSGFPGEAGGMLSHARHWRDIERATLSYGYGMSVTPLQLTRAYSVLAADGMMRPVSFLKVTQAVKGQRVVRSRVARQVRQMMEKVVQPGGTGMKAAIQGYRVAGKTGTAKKAIAGGYSDDRYVAVFAGLAPASQPRLAMVVVINEPRGKVYYGGQVAAPVFSRVMAGALRLMGIAPDDSSAHPSMTLAAATAAAAGAHP